MLDDDQADDDMLDGEIEIRFEPRLEVLARHGLSEEQFETALLDALEAYDQQVAAAENDDDLPELEDVTLQIDGSSYRLGDLAEISIAYDGDEPE